MKKYLVLLLFFLFISTACSNQTNTVTDSIRFKNEYEALNNKEGAISVNIMESNVIKYADYQDISNILNDTGIILFSYPECTKCREIVPILLDAAEVTGMDSIYYYNDEKILNSDIINILGDKVSEYLLNNNIKELYYPTIIFVREGEVLELYTSNEEKTEMNDNDKKQLSDTYINYIHEVLNDLCNATC